MKHNREEGWRPSYSQPPHQKLKQINILTFFVQNLENNQWYCDIWQAIKRENKRKLKRKKIDINLFPLLPHDIILFLPQFSIVIKLKSDLPSQIIYKHYQISSIKIPQQQTHTRLKCKKRMKGDIAFGNGVDPQRCTTRDGCVGEWSNDNLNRICVHSSLRFNVSNESSIIARGGPFWWWWFFFFSNSFSSVWIMFVSFSLIFGLVGVVLGVVVLFWFGDFMMMARLSCWCNSTRWW